MIGIIAPFIAAQVVDRQSLRHLAFINEIRDTVRQIALKSWVIFF
jgi:hypothetical protein